MSMTTPATVPTGRIPAPAVVLSRLRRTYPNGPGVSTALDDVTFSLPQGTFTAVMGPSGSGKSTFLNCASGLDVPTSGRVVIGGTDLTMLSPDAVTRFRRRHIGFIFQAYNLIGHLTVAENIALPLQLDGRRADTQWQQRLISAVGLNGKEDQYPGELSGGQAQRVAIARALIARPDVVFADEPTGALDRHTGQKVLQVLRTTAHELGQTLVLVTHDAQVATAADRVLLLSDGRLAGDLTAPSTDQIVARLTKLEG
ncbi:MAG: ABC transporter ATP-binding protein [Micrococcaceae bacterium]|nr:ABC transporter ATP-binding protein [Micrococcaceae bacterium]